MPHKLFISYRRADSSGHAGRIYDHLKLEFGADALFMDVDDAIPVGRVRTYATQQTGSNVVDGSRLM
jgi:hypothetical protein